ncbi:MAG: hypothetical protein H0X51_06945 [Parachlamydiaceae bacterium]|nr:hypothetical protein [Parachlamydiaceae bacterium]
MNEDQDTPDLPFKKTDAISWLEQQGFDQRESMDPYEMKEKIQIAADSMARAYLDKKGTDREKCEMVIASALSEMGASLGGNFGATMVGMSEKAAQRACLIVFPEG